MDAVQVTNNYVGLNRGRGMIIKASNGVITGNTVLLPKLPGIMFVPGKLAAATWCQSLVKQPCRQPRTLCTAWS